MASAGHGEDFEVIDAYDYDGHIYIFQARSIIAIPNAQHYDRALFIAELRRQINRINIVLSALITAAQCKL